MKLNAAQVRKHINNPPPTGAKTYGDGRGGHGLTLCVRSTGAAHWYQRLSVHGKPVNIGLGPCSLVTLSEARTAALSNHRDAYRGVDPRRRADGMPTVEHALRETAAARNASPEWTAPINIHARSILDRRVDEVTTADAMAVLVPIWNEKRDTARKVKQRLSATMRWAVAKHHRADDPFGAVINAALPMNGHKVKHHKALPHDEVADAMRNVDASDRAWIGTKLAFKFLVLTACRSGEVRGATWSEIDFDKALWTIPADRMKMDLEHRVPLSSAALDVLTEAREIDDGSGLVFPSARGKLMSDSTVSKLLRERGVDAVPHGFRSTFRDWCSEVAKAPRDVAESALAHVEGNAVVAAYARSDLLERRRELMQAWADYLHH